MQFTTACNDMFTTLLSGANHQRIGFGPQVVSWEAGKLRENTGDFTTERQQPMGLWVFFCWKILEECPTSVNFGPDSCWVEKLDKSSWKRILTALRPIKISWVKTQHFFKQAFKLTSRNSFFKPSTSFGKSWNKKAAPVAPNFSLHKIPARLSSTFKGDIFNDTSWSQEKSTWTLKKIDP